MTLTQPPAHQAQQRLDSVDYHLAELRTLLAEHSEVFASGTQQNSTASKESVYEDVVAMTFGRWVLETTGATGDITEQVRQARALLWELLELSRNGSISDAERDAIYHEPDDQSFDIFADVDVESFQDEELSPEPVDIGVRHG